MTRITRIINISACCELLGELGSVASFRGRLWWIQASASLWTVKDFAAPESRYVFGHKR